MTPADPNRRFRLLLYSFGVVLGGGYLIYSTTTKTGLGGWLMALQIQWFGSASETATFMVPLLVLVCLLALLLHRPGDQPAPQVVAAPSASATAKTLLWIAAVPPLLAVPAFFYFQRQAERDQNRPVVPLDLVSQPDAPVPADAKFVRLQGVFQADYQFILEETRYGRVEKTDRYVPLTGPAWRPGQPVRFFLDTNTSAYYDEANRRTLTFDNAVPFPVTFDGELSRGPLPTVVRLDFEKRGVTAADPYYMLAPLYFLNGRPPSAANQQYWLILVLGGALSVAVLLGGGLGLLMRRQRGL